MGRTVCEARIVQHQQMATWLLHRLTAFPAAACALQLALLDLTDNNIASLPPELGRMTTLRALPLSGNPIKGLRTAGPLSALLASLRNRLAVRCRENPACCREISSLVGAMLLGPGSLKAWHAILWRMHVANLQPNVCGMHVRSAGPGAGCRQGVGGPLSPAAA